MKIETLANMLSTRLDPADWLPDMFEVAIGDKQQARHVLVIRIRPELAPRPVMVQRTGSGGDGIFWVPARIPGGTRQATRAELAALFAEPGPGRLQPTDGWEADAPRLPAGPDGAPLSAVEMMLKTGLSVTPGPACPGRPLSEKVLGTWRSPWTSLRWQRRCSRSPGCTMPGSTNARRGRPNTSGTATLTWQIVNGDIPSFEITTRITAPGQYGHSDIQTLTVSLEITSRLTAWARSGASPPPPPGPVRRLETVEWAALLNAMTAALTSSRAALPAGSA